MMKRRSVAFLGAVCCLLSLIGGAMAAEVDSDGVYRFTAEELSEEPLAGVCLTSLPRGKLLLGDRLLRPGDILTAAQVGEMTYVPVRSEADAEVRLCFLPVYEDRVGAESVMTFLVRGKEDLPPVAEDFALETYKDLPIQGQLKVEDPEGEAMTYQILRRPKRGDLTLQPDGSFTYAPRKNKVGIDSFVYTATDVSGKVSREATVTVTILKTTDAPQYTDTADLDCSFAAEWMKNTGIFVGETVDGNPCFRPEATLTRGEFTAMLVKALELMEADTPDYTGYSDKIPQWLRPYVAAAVRCGATAGLPQQEIFGAEEPLTGAEAAVMLRNVLDLSVDVTQTAAMDPEVPEWARHAVQAMAESGMALEANGYLTRGEAAMILYRASGMTTDRTRNSLLEQ